MRPNHYDLRRDSGSDNRTLLWRLRALVLRVRNLLARRHLDADLAAELEAHLQLHVEDNIRAGVVPHQLAVRQRALSFQQTRQLTPSTRSSGRASRAWILGRAGS